MIGRKHVNIWRDAPCPCCGHVAEAISRHADPDGEERASLLRGERVTANRVAELARLANVQEAEVEAWMRQYDPRYRQEAD